MLTIRIHESVNKEFARLVIDKLIRQAGNYYTEIDLYADTSYKDEDLIAVFHSVEDSRFVLGCIWFANKQEYEYHS